MCNNNDLQIWFTQIYSNWHHLDLFQVTFKTIFSFDKEKVEDKITHTDTRANILKITIKLKTINHKMKLTEI